MKKCYFLFIFSSFFTVFFVTDAIAMEKYYHSDVTIEWIEMFWNCDKKQTVIQDSSLRKNLLNLSNLLSNLSKSENNKLVEVAHSKLMRKIFYYVKNLLIPYLEKLLKGYPNHLAVKKCLKTMEYYINGTNNHLTLTEEINNFLDFIEHKSSKSEETE